VILYFAYGSNMSIGDLREWVPNAAPVGKAYLPDYRLRFSRRSRRSGTGVVDIVVAPRMRVWGMLFDVPADELAGLDRKEGVGVGAYARCIVEVVQPGRRRVAAMAYAVVEKEVQEVAPSASYLARMLAAAEENGFPGSYLAFLRSLAKEAAAALGGSRRFR
jgi:cation transport regulator ChaC